MPKEEMQEIKAFCGMCDTMHAFEVPVKGFDAWQNGELIQTAMPKVPAAMRELLISGMCEECWDKALVAVTEVLDDMHDFDDDDPSWFDTVEVRQDDLD